MANEKEKQTIDEIEKTVEELRKKIELLTRSNDHEEASEPENVNEPKKEESSSIDIDYDDNLSIPTFSEEKQNESSSCKFDLNDGLEKLNSGYEAIKKGIVDIHNDPKVIKARTDLKEKSLKALDSLKDTLANLKDDPNVKESQEKAKRAYEQTTVKISGWVSDGIKSLNENPDTKKVMDSINTGISKTGAVINEIMENEKVQHAIDKAKDGAIYGTQKFADIVRETLKKDTKE